MLHAQRIWASLKARNEKGSGGIHRSPAPVQKASALCPKPTANLAQTGLNIAFARQAAGPGNKDECGPAATRVQRPGRRRTWAG